MKKTGLFLLLLFSLFLLQYTTAAGKTGENQAESPEVKNVIIMVGDGMGVTQVYAGLTGNKGHLYLERCHFVGFSKTYSADAYTTDSAAGGTAIACGTKTYNGAIGVDANGIPVKSMLEYASENGLATGVVVSCDVTHATPASFVAHQAKRSMAEEIAEDFVNSDLTVFIGGGRKRFEKRSDKQNLTDQLKAKGFTVAYSLEEAKKVTSGKLAALVADEHPEKYPERGELLPEGVQTAINLLKQNDKGFCLMVEASQIDWACHEKMAKETVSEMIDFDRAIQVAFDYADKDPNTLVIITADHETGGMALADCNMDKGRVEAGWGVKGHTGVMVPVFAYGAGAKEFAGIYENSDILPKVLRLYGFDELQAQKSKMEAVSAQLLESEMIYEKAPFPSCHASTIVETKDGLLAAWFGGTHENNPDVCIYASRKEKNGKWTTPELVADGIQSPSQRYPCWNPVLYKRDNGDIVLYYKVGPSPSTWWGEYKISEDEGKTWSVMTEIPRACLGPVKNKPVRLSSGKILYPTSIEIKGKWNVYMEMSEQDLSDWGKVEIDNNGFDAIQPSVLSYKDGSLQILCRSKNQRIVEAWSRDEGKTWSKLTATSLPNNNSGTDAVTLSSGLQLLIYNPVTKGRNRLAIAASADGKNWRKLLDLEDEPAGEFSYPAIIEDEKGIIHATYTYNRKQVKYVKLQIAGFNQ